MVDVWVDSVVGVIDVEGVVFRELVFYVGGTPPAHYWTKKTSGLFVTKKEARSGASNHLKVRPGHGSRRLVMEE